MILGSVTSKEEDFHKQLANILRKSLKYDQPLAPPTCRYFIKGLYILLFILLIFMITPCASSCLSFTDEKTKTQECLNNFY